MNLLLLTTDDLIKDKEVIISGRRFEHLEKILKVTAGDKVDVGLLNGKTGSGQIIRKNKKSLALSIQLDKSPPPPTPLTLVLALPRPLMLKRILQTVTSMGVKEIHLLNTQRVEKSYWNSSDLAEDVIYHQLILGLEQSRDTVLPNVYFHKHFKIFIDNTLTEITGSKRALLADIGNYSPCPCNIQEPTVLAIGPEGGFIPDEVKQFIEKGFDIVQIGQRPLRVEAAVTALLGRLLPI